MERTVTEERIENFKVVLRNDRVTESTIEKYVNDIKKLTEYLQDKEITLTELEHYKEWLIEEKKYKKSSVNSYIASINRFLRTMKWDDCELSMFSLYSAGQDKSQKFITRDDYKKLVTSAMQQKDYRMAMLIQTLCHVNIRFSELNCLTVESLESEEIEVSRRNRSVYLKMPDNLRISLCLYAEYEGISDGVLFRTSTGKVIDRSNAWRRIKELCAQSGIDTDRVSLVNIKMPVMNDYYPFYEMPVD